MTNEMMNNAVEVEECYQEGARYRGLVLYAKSADGTYWVVGAEKWMTPDEMDEYIENGKAGRK